MSVAGFTSGLKVREQWEQRSMKQSEAEEGGGGGEGECRRTVPANRIY